MKISTLITFIHTFLVSHSIAMVLNHCKTAGMIALTFDDGPSENTIELLDLLQSKGVRATFHLTTQHLTDPAVQDSLFEITSAGHLIGLRTETRWDLLKMSDKQIRTEFARHANIMASFIGYYPKFVRLPYGGYDDRVLKAVESTGAVVTTHNLETYDYTNDGNRVVNAVQLATSLLAPGAGSFIVVQHDGVQQSVAVSGKVIEVAQKAAYKLVTLDACLGMGDMTKNKVALKGGNGTGGALPMGPGAAGGKIPGGSSGPSGSLGLPGDDSPLPVGGKKINAASAQAKLSGIALAAGAAAMACLAL